MLKFETNYKKWLNEKSQIRFKEEGENRSNHPPHFKKRLPKRTAFH